ncbi:unnamed protein product [Closterium sp. NIES-64]|nr:unnamed protein product [Closterium sp. NIES-64]CAI5947935.1 unnamed protein product [Closterium sp. NIES-65]
MVKVGQLVRLEELIRAVALFRNLTHLHLANESVQILTDDFLVHLASWCPKLKGVHFAPESPCYFWRREEWKDRFLVTAPGLDSFFRGCPQLEQLTLPRSEHGYSLPASFFQLPNPRFLFLSDASVLLDPRLAHLSNLSMLTIRSKFLGVDHLLALTQLTALTRLSSYRTDISFKINGSSSSFALLSSLRSLQFGELPALKVLELEDLPLTVLPESFSQLASLESFHVVRCKIRQLPSGITTLPSLKSLRLEGRKGRVSEACEKQQGVVGADSAAREGKTQDESMARENGTETVGGEGGQGVEEFLGQGAGGGEERRTGEAAARGQGESVAQASAAAAAGGGRSDIVRNKQTSQFDTSARVAVDVPGVTAPAAETIAEALASEMAGDVAIAIASRLGGTQKMPGSAAQDQSRWKEDGRCSRGKDGKGVLKHRDVLFKSSRCVAAPGLSEGPEEEELEFEVVVVGRRRKITGTLVDTPTATPREGMGRAGSDGEEGVLQERAHAASEWEKRARGLKHEGRSRHEKEKTEKTLFV